MPLDYFPTNNVRRIDEHRVNLCFGYTMLPEKRKKTSPEIIKAAPAIAMQLR